LVFDVSDLPRPIIRYGVGLWRRRWVVVAAAWAIALAGWFGVWLLPDQYESRAQVHVQIETILEPVMTGVTARPNYEQRVEVMRQQLLTRPNVEEIVYRAGLDKEIEARSEMERRTKLEGMIDWVAGKIKIDSPLSMYFNISYRYGDPEIAKNVVDAVLNLLIEQDLGASIAEKEEAKRLLDAQIREFDERLTAKEREVAEFRRLHADELAVSEGKARKREQKETELARISDQLSSEQRRVSTLTALLSTTPRVSAGSELDALKIQLAQLRSQYKESYPDIEGLKARIRELESGGVGVLPENPEFVRLRNELRAAEGAVADLSERETRARAELDALAVAIGEAPGVEADLQRIIRDYEQTQKSYEELAARRDRLSLTANLGAGGRGVEYQIFERPTTALRPVAPPRFLLIIAVLFVALIGGAALALLITYVDRTYTQSADLQKAFGLPVLGSIGNVSSEFHKAMRRADLLKLAGAGAGLAIFAVLYAYVTVWRLPGEGAAVGDRTAGLNPTEETR
jgi:polysaccharide chain length determinant protein (PEP-CTERM system associated)